MLLENSSPPKFVNTEQTWSYDLDSVTSKVLNVSSDLVTSSDLDIAVESSQQNIGDYSIGKHWLLCFITDVVVVGVGVGVVVVLLIIIIDGGSGGFVLICSYYCCYFCHYYCRLITVIIFIDKFHC